MANEKANNLTMTCLEAEVVLVETGSCHILDNKARCPRAKQRSVAAVVGKSGAEGNVLGDGGRNV